MPQVIQVETQFEKQSLTRLHGPTAARRTCRKSAFNRREYAFDASSQVSREHSEVLHHSHITDDRITCECNIATAGRRNPVSVFASTVLPQDVGVALKVQV